MKFVVFVCLFFNVEEPKSALHFLLCLWIETQLSNILTILGGDFLVFLFINSCFFTFIFTYFFTLHILFRTTCYDIICLVGNKGTNVFIMNFIIIFFLNAVFNFLAIVMIIKLIINNNNVGIVTSACKEFNCPVSMSRNSPLHTVYIRIFKSLNYSQLFLFYFIYLSIIKKKNVSNEK